MRVRVTAIAPVTENMPGGRAIKPGDVLTIRNGKTIEVLNTDAEGRLVLADGLSLAAEMQPDAIIDLATLTGACVVALGTGIAGMFGNERRARSARVQAASARAGERTWPLPLPDEYRSHIDSDIADMKNIGKAGQAGAIAAALLLARFVEGVPWVTPRHRRSGAFRRGRWCGGPRGHRLRRAHAAGAARRVRLLGVTASVGSSDPDG